jgi:hypothetical protein
MPSNGYVNKGCLAMTLVRNNTGKKLFSVWSVPSLYHLRYKYTSLVCKEFCGCRPTRVVLGGIVTL